MQREKIAKKHQNVMDMNFVTMQKGFYGVQVANC
jgi:hypothetical protein